MKNSENDRIAWDRVALLAVVITLALYLLGCATPNTGQCPPEYRANGLRDGKIVVWCTR